MLPTPPKTPRPTQLGFWNGVDQTNGVNVGCNRKFSHRWRCRIWMLSGRRSVARAESTGKRGRNGGKGGAIAVRSSRKNLRLRPRAAPTPSSTQRAQLCTGGGAIRSALAARCGKKAPTPAETPAYRHSTHLNLARAAQRRRLTEDQQRPEKNRGLRGSTTLQSKQREHGRCSPNAK